MAGKKNRVMASSGPNPTIYISNIEWSIDDEDLPTSDTVSFGELFDYLDIDWEDAIVAYLEDNYDEYFDGFDYEVSWE